jgi:3-hydroxy acid dehydrogenase/malonic semialdehyde reductase
MRELVDTPIRVTEIQPGMVETDFSNTRYRGDKAAAKDVYRGLEPCEPFSFILQLAQSVPSIVVPEDIAEEIVWAASRPPHVNIAEVYVIPVNQASPSIVHRAP